ncbi:alpha-(1,3)-fucosyltransferase C-like isoform X2 [Paramacrobiotus metropolitanus]|nr:alpha-(1,3)-fucosyltransferase C-like isoform X2 [Paramacrobiotus metropolitanus]
MRTILLWDKFPDFSLTTGNDMFQRFKCTYPNCRMTFDRKFLSTANAVLFSLRETTRLEHLPKSRSADQKWVFCLKESPVYSYFDEQLLDGVFDWTMTYRLDSDILFPYGFSTKRSKPQTKLPDYFEKKINHTMQYAFELAAYRKLAPIAWIVSRCQSHSHRETYVDQLTSHIDVDIYGRCGQLDCGKDNNSTTSCDNILKSYHFYLALENSLCPDYVTEKLFKILAVHDYPVIPVVMGGANYSALAPPGSFVNALDFDSPADLAQYLQRILADRLLYNSFHEWRKVYTVVPWGTPLAFCKLCEKLHTNVGKGKRRDLRTFWDKQGCNQNFSTSAVIL